MEAWCRQSVPGSSKVQISDMQLSTVLWAVLFLAAAATAKIQPAKHYFNICHTSDPNFQECIKSTLIKLHPYILKGIPDLKVPSFEPLHIEKIEMGDGSGNFKLHFVLSNLVINGMSKHEILDLSMDLKKMEMNLTLVFFKLDFESDYVIEGQIMVLPIKGNGMASFNFTDVTTFTNAKLEEFTKGGKTYLRVKDYNFKINPKYAQSNFTNLFNGDKRLGDSTNKFLNENWKDAFNTYSELPEKAFAEYLKSVVNRVFSLYPKDELFPK